MQNRDLILNVPVPSKTETYTPVTAKHIYDTVDQLCAEYGFNIKSEKSTASKNGFKQSFSFNIDVGHPEYGFNLCVINSYDKSLTFKFAGGSSAFICTNGMLVGSTQYIRRHRGSIDKDIYDYFKIEFINAKNYVGDTIGFIEKLNETVIEEEYKETLIENMVQEKMLSKRQLKALYKEYETSSYFYNSNENSLNELYQHVTFVIQKSHPSKIMESKTAVFNFFKSLILN